MIEKEIAQIDADNPEDFISFNQKAWDLAVSQNNRWTVPVSDKVIAAARNGDFKIILTPKTPLPKEWLADIKDKKILALASGGGQQGPILAAAGADVTVVDLSEKQLEQDLSVAKRENLQIATLCCSADHLSGLDDQSFDIILNPVSNCFFPELTPVWKECARVLKKGGWIAFGFNNPISYCFDFEKANRGHFEMKYPLPFSDMKSFDDKEKARFLRKEAPLEFSHTLTDQISGILKSGFVITDFFEDPWDVEEPINRFFPQFMVIRATRQ